MQYDYPSFRLPRLLDDFAFRGGPRPGEPFPDFDLPTVDGDRITRTALLADGPALVTMASYTCPMTASAGPVLRELHRDFGHPVSFLTLYVREAHPGRHVPQPDSMEMKLRHARKYRDRDRISWPVAVDDPQGGLHRQLDAKPNAAYLVAQDGTVLFRTLSANHEWTLREGLAVVAAGGRPMEQREPRFMPMAAAIGELDRVLHLAGEDARRDVLYRAPPVYLMGRLAGALPFSGPLRQGLGAAGVVFGLVLGGAVAATRARRGASGGDASTRLLP